jgi:hypothetical protein
VTDRPASLRHISARGLGTPFTRGPYRTASIRCTPNSREYHPYRCILTQHYVFARWPGDDGFWASQCQWYTRRFASTSAKHDLSNVIDAKRDWITLKLEGAGLLLRFDLRIAARQWPCAEANGCSLLGNPPVLPSAMLNGVSTH